MQLQRSVTWIDLSAYVAKPAHNPNKVPCQAVVLRGKVYDQCRSTYSRIRGNWLLCTVHARLDELEVNPFARC